MALTIGTVTVDTTDALPLAQWWAEQVGGTIEQENDGYYVIVKLPGDYAPRMAFQKVPDPTPGKNRIHLDLLAPDLTAETERLVAAGAEVVDRQEMDGFLWNVFADPDGNRFCVAAAGS